MDKEEAICFWCEKEFEYNISDYHVSIESENVDGEVWDWDEYLCPHCNCRTRV
jgi:hypothetical protein